MTSAVGLIIGFSLFGAVTFLPLFQQVVRGQSPTASGLQLLPLMGGVMLSSVVSGRLIARTGRYRMYPIARHRPDGGGPAPALDAWAPAPAMPTAAAFMAVLGLGLGMVMQVLILAVQNDAPYEDLGRRHRRRHAVPLDRRLARHRHPRRGLHEPPRRRADDRLPRRRGRGGALGQRRPGGRGRPARARCTHAYLAGFSGAFTTVFLAAAAVSVVAFALTWLIREVPLRTTVREAPPQASRPASRR